MESRNASFCFQLLHEIGTWKLTWSIRKPQKWIAWFRGFSFRRKAQVFSFRIWVFVGDMGYVGSTLFPGCNRVKWRFRKGFLEAKAVMSSLVVMGNPPASWGMGMCETYPGYLQKHWNTRWWQLKYFFWNFHPETLGVHDPIWRAQQMFQMGWWKHQQRKATVDGRNPAPPRMMIIPLLIGF